jgi:hypothetical protein
MKAPGELKYPFGAFLIFYPLKKQKGGGLDEYDGPFSIVDCVSSYCY